jgi:FAD binding domain-containing protein
MDTGIQDAYNLAWKIALVLKGEASAKLLDTYDEERRPVGADVVFRTRAASEQFGRRQAGPQDRLEDTQVLVNYRGSSLSLDDVSDSLEQLPVRAGDRAPDCSGLRRENVRHPLRLFDVMRGIEHVLLVYVGPFAESGQVELLEGIAQKLKAFRGPKCRVTAVCSADAKKPYVLGATVLTDSLGEFADAYAPSLKIGFLIRPDGYIGLHSRPVTADGFFRYFETLS